MTIKNSSGEALQKRANDAVMPLYPHKKVALEKADGCYVYDTDGNKYLDCAAGIAVSALGHNHPAFNKAITEQIEQRLYHVRRLLRNPTQSGCRRITDPATVARDQIFFCNSGAEAVEGCYQTSTEMGTCE